MAPAPPANTRYTPSMAFVRATPVKPLTVEEYLSFEEPSSVRHEYVGGELYALAGATDRHNRLAMNISGHLWSAARGGPCRVYGSDMRLRAAEDLFYYPDVTVVCDEQDTEEMYKTSPCVAVEVLSPSTASTDRREKVLAYRRLPSLKAYVIVYRDEVHVERHYRDPQGAWWHAEVVSDGRVPFPCPEIELTLAEIYEGLAPPSTTPST